MSMNTGTAGTQAEVGSIASDISSGRNQSTGKIFHLEDRSGAWGFKLWTLTFDLPGEKVNKLGKPVMQEIDGLLPQLEEMGKRGEIEALVLLSGKPGNFIAGADIEMIQAVSTAEEGAELSRMGQRLMSRWEDLPFPTVAAVDGAALGGGCEFALACTAIVMSNDPAARIGVPEVMLGLIPGAGGCVRLPRKVGLATALDMILTGKQLNGERAYKAGLADGFIPKESFSTSVLQWTKSNHDKLKAGARIARQPKLGGMGGAAGSFLEKTAMGRRIVFKKAREGVLSKTRGHYPAPLAALDVVQEAGGHYGPRIRGEARERAMAREAEAFGRLSVTEESRNLIRLFFLTEAVKKSNGLPAGTSASARKVRAAGVLGAGVMGGGIAQLLAEKNVPVRMKDLNKQALETGIQAASKIFKKKVKRKRMSDREFVQKIGLIAPTTEYAGFQSTDLIIEAVIEKMEIKQKVFQELENHVTDDCVVASNTSSLSISEMQSVMKRPERFAGMHFFNPVHRMPLIEVIRGKQSSDDAVATVFEFSKKIGKTPIVVKDEPGFLVNRLLMPYLNEATWLLADGATIPEIDQVLLDFGMPMGPMELIDEVGIDVGEKVANILHAAFGARVLPSPFHHKVVEAGYLGKKNSKGLYQYKDGGRKKEFDPKIYEVLSVTPSPGTVSREEILERCVLPMINEASRCLEEKVVATPSEVDLGMIMGTGFPPFRGGLLRYADTLGPQAIVEKLRKYEPRLGKRFEPAPSLLRRAEHDQKFYND